MCVCEHARDADLANLRMSATASTALYSCSTRLVAIATLSQTLVLLLCLSSLIYYHN